MLDRLGLGEDVAPYLFGEVGGDGGDEEGGSADPGEDEVAVHTDVAGDLAVPVTSALKLVETVLQGILVVGTGFIISTQVGLREVEGNDSRFVVTVGDVDQIVDLILKDGIMVIPWSSPEVSLVLNHVL